MRIGIVGTLWFNTPPEKYGGTEEVIYNLVNGLTACGHEVTFFGPKTAKVNAKIIPTVERPLRDMNVSWENISYTLYHMIQVFSHEKDFDILHVHLNKAQDYVALPFSVYKNTPTLFTPHFRLPNATYRPDRYEILQMYRKLPFSSISYSQQEKEFNFIANIYNSIRINEFTFGTKPDDYFVWLGKIMPIKGTKEAILAAKKARKKLFVLGAIEYGVPEFLAYYKNEVAPLIDNKSIFFYENVDMAQKSKLLSRAQALLNPISWDEPFGLVMIESQACGTPVIAYKKGATKEVVKDRTTGFLVDSLEGMVIAMEKIKTIDRANCRQFVEDNFSVEKMVEGYLGAYQTVLKHWDEYYERQIKLEI